MENKLTQGFQKKGYKENVNVRNCYTEQQLCYEKHFTGYIVTVIIGVKRKHGHYKKQKR